MARVIVTRGIDVKTFPTAFATEKNKKTGAKPVWILMLTVNSVNYFIANRVLSIPSFTGSSPWPASTAITTKKWAKSWGQLQEGISNSLAEFNVSSYTFEAIIDPDASPNMETLCTQYDIEESAARLFLWFEGCTDFPQMMFSGFVKDITIPSDTSVILTIQDDSIKLERCYIGTKLDTTTYPLADPDDIGKVIPIVYNAVEKVPALCVDSGWVSSLVTDINGTEPSFRVSEIPTATLVGRTFSIDDEQMTVTASAAAAPYENKAFAGCGSTISSTSTASGTTQSSLINGNRLTPGGLPDLWKSAVAASGGSPVTLEITFTAPMLVDKFNIFFPADDLASTVEPVLNSTTGTLYTGQAFTIDIYIGYWLNIGVSYGNAYRWRQWNSTGDVATKARVVFTSNCAGGYACCAEIEVWGRLDGAPAGNWLTVTRAVNGTLAAVHTKAATAIEKKTTPLVYLCSDRPLNSIDTIHAKVRGVLVDITDDCTTYLDIAAGDFAGKYVGKAGFTIPDIAAVHQRISLQLIGDVTASDPGHSHNTGTSGDTSVTHTATGVSNTLTESIFTWTASENQSRFPGARELSKTVNFTAITGTIKTCNLTVSVSGYLPSTGGYWYLLLGGKRITPYMTSFADSPTITQDATSMQGNDLTLVVAAIPTGAAGTSLTAYAGGTIVSASRSITYNNGATVTIVPGPSLVAVENTLELTGNSVADVMIGSSVLVTMTRTMASVSAIFDDVLSRTSLSASTVSLTGTLPASYALDGAITESDTALRILNRLAMQIICFFKFSGGVPRLIYRTGSPTSVKTIAAVKTSGGRSTLFRQKTATTEIINKIDLQYLLDYSKPKGPTAFRAVSTGEWAATQAVYGVQENPNLFFFDFVKSATHADDLKFFYLLKYLSRHWLYTFDAFLDNCEIEFADYITMSFVAGSPLGQVIRAEYYPGDTSRTHVIRLTVIV